MRQEQFIRFVQEICFLLKLSQPCSKTALNYFLAFKQYEGHSYDQEIIIATSIYLSVKIFQQQARIRDILNMIYLITSLYRLSFTKAQQQHKKSQISQESKPNNEENEDEQSFINLKNLKNQQNLHEMIQPQYSLQNYNEYKGKIIEAEQILLRIIGFDFKLAEKNKVQIKQILIMIHHLRCPSTMAKIILKLYNDIHYIDIQYWVEGVIYFGYIATKIYINRYKTTQKRSLLSSKELKEVQNLENFFRKVKPSDLTGTFCTEVKNLQKYVEKLIMFYENINICSQASEQKVNISNPIQISSQSSLKKDLIKQQ